MPGFRVTYISEPKENNKDFLDRVEGSIEILDDADVKISVQLITKDKYEEVKWYRDIFMLSGKSMEEYKESLMKLSSNLEDEYHKEKIEREKSLIGTITVENIDEASNTAELNIGINLGESIKTIQERLARIEERLSRLEQPFSWPWPNTTPSIPTIPNYPWTTGDPIYPQYPSYPIITCENDPTVNLRTIVQGGVDNNIQC
jgi:hypothetical protein